MLPSSVDNLIPVNQFHFNPKMKLYFNNVFFSLVIIHQVCAIGFRPKKDRFHIQGVDNRKDATKFDNVFFDNRPPLLDSHQTTQNYNKKAKPNGFTERHQTIHASIQPSTQQTPQFEPSNRKPPQTDFIPTFTLEYHSPGDNGTTILETTNENCKITMHQFIATTQAAVTHTLNGLCSKCHIEERLFNLENSLLDHLSTIKTTLLTMEKRLASEKASTNYGQKPSGAGNPGEPSRGSDGSLLQEVNTESHQSEHEMRSPVLDEEEQGEPHKEKESVRDAEILKYNSSIHTETGLNNLPQKVFTYYWKVNNMTYKLSGSSPRKSFRSQSFYIFPSGYRMYMRVFHRENEGTLYVRVGLTKGEFDESLKWPFSLRHKVHVLDQTREGKMFEDIASNTWDPNLLCSDFNWQKPANADNQECAEVAFPHQILRHRDYILRDALIIKFTVYLES